VQTSHALVNLLLVVQFLHYMALKLAIRNVISLFLWCSKQSFAQCYSLFYTVCLFNIFFNTSYERNGLPWKLRLCDEYAVFFDCVCESIFKISNFSTNRLCFISYVVQVTACGRSALLGIIWNLRCSTLVALAPLDIQQDST
jgi:hypothetical protein